MKFKGLQQLFEVMLLTIPSLWNVGVLFFMVLFMFGVFAHYSFKGIPYSPGRLSKHANFDTFGSSLLTLFQVSTADTWTDVMLGCSEEVPWASAFFVVFMVLCNIILPSLYIVAVLDTYEMHSIEDL